MQAYGVEFISHRVYIMDTANARHVLLYASNKYPDDMENANMRAQCALLDAASQPGIQSTYIEHVGNRRIWVGMNGDMRYDYVLKERP